MASQVVYKSSDDSEYSNGRDDFKMQVEALGTRWQPTLTRIHLIVVTLDNSQSPTQPLTKVLGEKLSILQKITLQAPHGM